MKVHSEQRQFEGVDEEIHLITLTPDTAQRATLLFVHGHGEFVSRYTELFAPLVDTLGIKILMPDLPGHGVSTGKRGHMRDLGQVATLFHQLSDEAKKSADGLPLFLAGHSMGGLLSAWLVLEQGMRPDAVWIGSPLLVPGKAKPPLVVAVAKLLDKLAPTMVIHNGVKESDCYTMEDAADFPAETDADKWQPVEVVHRWISMRLGMELVRAENQVWSESMDHWPVDIPLIFTQGGKDPVCPPENGREFTRRLKEAGRDVTYHEFPEALHEPHRDGHSGELMSLVTDWFSGQLEKPV